MTNLGFAVPLEENMIEDQIYLRTKKKRKIGVNSIQRMGEEVQLVRLSRFSDPTSGWSNSEWFFHIGNGDRSNSFSLKNIPVTSMMQHYFH